MLFYLVLSYLLSLVFKIAKSKSYALWVSAIACVGYTIYYTIKIWVSTESVDLPIIYPILITILFLESAFLVLFSIGAAKESLD